MIVADCRSMRICANIACMLARNSKAVKLEANFCLA